MKTGAVVEIEIDTVGVLRNPIAVGGSIATGPPSPRAVCPQGHTRVTISPEALPWRQAGMSRSVEPAGPDLPPPQARGGATAGASTPVAERLAAWVDRALRPGGLAPRRALLGALLSMAAIFAVDMLTGESVRLEALYVFPIASVALHCERLSHVVVAIVVAVAMQALGLGMQDETVLIRILDSGVAVAASLLAVALARTLRRHYQASEERAATDALTGLPNRRAFDAVLEAEIDVRRRHGGAFSLALIDLDRFKALNDSMGHAAGDLALRLVSDTLSARVRASDAAARLGGDEFIVLLRNAPARDVERIRETLVSAIDRRLEGAGFAVTASCGVATFEAPPASAALALEKADRAMYAVKATHGGRGPGEGPRRDLP
jgi:diguanylate cyclase (GGDEF)-like protein